MIEARHAPTHREISTQAPGPDADTTCANCEAVLEGPFCSACGHRHRGERLSLGSLLGEFLQRLLNFDRGFLGTAKALTLAPGDPRISYSEGQNAVAFAHPRVRERLTTALPEAAMPDAAQPGAAQPSAAQPETPQPEAPEAAP